MVRALLLLVLCTVLTTILADVKIEDCGSKVHNVKFTCETGCYGDVLQLKKGSDDVFKLSFHSGDHFKTLKNNIVGILGGGLEIPYNSILPEDFCSGLGPQSCPIKADSWVSFSSSVKVLNTYPSIPVTIKWEVKTETGENAVCILIKSKIV